MFKLMGNMIGNAFRSKSCMPFNLVPLIWKQLADMKPTEQDLDSIDAYTFQTFKTLRKMAKKIKDVQEFEAKAEGQNFMYVVGTKKIELCPGGEDRLVN
jgi:hypothetical protein